MKGSLALSVILDDRESDDKYAQAYVDPNSIVAMQEDLDDENCCYILVASHTMHINLSLNDLKKMLNP